MRASEIRTGSSYAATGNQIQLAKVKVLERSVGPRHGNAQFKCVVEGGSVYSGWFRQNGVLDMAYKGVGDHVWLTSRDILRSWEEEEVRRAAMTARRKDINMILTEMDALLNDLNLPDAQLQLVELGKDRFIAVTVLGIDEIRRLHDQITEQRGVG